MRTIIICNIILKNANYRQHSAEKEEKETRPEVPYQSDKPTYANY
jgi:hypothetical protein